MKHKTESYDPSWLVELARKEHPNEHWLQEELKKCTQRLLLSDDQAMVYFVNPQDANKPGSDWQFDFNIEFEGHDKGGVVIDILKGRKIGAVELLWLIKK